MDHQLEHKQQLCALEVQDAQPPVSAKTEVYDGSSSWTEVEMFKRSLESWSN